MTSSASNRAYMRRRREAARDEGVCQNCTKRDARHGRTTCDYCAKQHSKRLRIYRESEPLTPHVQDRLEERTAMIRLVVITSDAIHAANVGGEVARSAKTFDVDLPELEAALLPALGNDYVSKSLTYEIL